MAYSRSLARQDFLKNILEIQTVSRKADYKKSNVPESALEMIYQAAIFKACAYLEEYLKSIIQDWLYLVEQNGYTCAQIPNNLRLFLISKGQEGAYKAFIFQGDEKALLKKLDKNKYTPLLNLASPVKGLLDTNLVVGDRKYPSIKNIRRLFVRIGINKIFEDMQRRYSVNHTKPLQSFLDVREAIAHQNPPNLTYADVKMHLEHLRKLVNDLDRTIYSHVVRETGLDCWRAR